MKKNLSKISTLVLVLLLSISIKGMATVEYKHPAQTLSELSGKTVREIKEEHNLGKSYGEIAKSYGVLDKFKLAKLNARKEKIEGLVRAGKISKEEGQKMYDDFKAYLDKWDGSGDLEKKFKVGRRNIHPNREGN